MVYIDVPDMNDSVGRITLNKTEYYIRFTYNAAYDYWSFGIYDLNMNPIIPMVKVVPNVSLLHYYVYTDIPEGIFGCLSKLNRIGRNAFVEKKADFFFINSDDLDRYNEYVDSLSTEDSYTPVAVDNP